MQPWGLIRKSKEEFGIGFYNPFLDFALLVEDITPNNMHTGAKQIQRPRIDHVNEKPTQQTKKRKA